MEHWIPLTVVVSILVVEAAICWWWRRIATECLDDINKRVKKLERGE